MAAANTNSMISLRAVTKRFGNFTAVDAATFDIAAGEFFSLLGPSGCGKTTLLRMIGGFERQSTGEILIDGEPMGTRAPNQRPTNMVFQSYAIFPHLDVAENIAYGLANRPVDKATIARKVAAALEMMRLDGLGNRRTNQLSGGQRQRVALARAIVCEPKVLLLDEPLGALDKKLREEMQIELRQLQKSLGITFIFVTHDQEEALSLSDRIAVMARGKVLQIDTATALYEHPNCREVAGFIGNMNFLEGRIAGVEGGLAAIEIGDGQVVKVPANGQAAAGGNAILAIRPEKIDAHGSATAPQPGTNAIRARARASSYLGDRSLILADWRNGAAPVSVSLQNRKSLSGDGSSGIGIPGPDSELWLTWPVEAGVLLTS
ncbi:MAG: ABC transporter ATP-binding protein [Rhodospirillaceae bacterium]|nr:ABC transporter ATP-binding protein [Rhodospirillaceae bacterium]